VLAAHCWRSLGKFEVLLSAVIGEGQRPGISRCRAYGGGCQAAPAVEREIETVQTGQHRTSWARPRRSIARTAVSGS
jgi:hypothetical protein